MSTGKPLPLKTLFDGPDTAVGHLLKRSAEVEALTAEVRRLVPEPLRPHILAACRREGTLHLVTDAAVWAAQLRYHVSDIRISMSAKQGYSWQNVEVSVRAGGSVTGVG